MEETEYVRGFIILYLIFPPNAATLPKLPAGGSTDWLPGWMRHIFYI
jgi:hypothetical protein